MKNVWEHEIVGFKIVAECKEDVFLEGFAVLHAYERAILFIQYLYPSDTRPEGRQSRKQCVDLLRSRTSSSSSTPIIFMDFTFFPSLANTGAKLDIVKADKTRMVEI